MGPKVLVLTIFLLKLTIFNGQRCMECPNFLQYEHLLEVSCESFDLANKFLSYVSLMLLSDACRMQQLNYSYFQKINL